MNQYLLAGQKGIPFLAVDFKDFTHNRQVSLQEIFAFTELDLDQIEKVMQVYETDSQHGTEVAKDGYQYQVTDSQTERFLAYLSLQDGCNIADYVLPNFISNQ